jgi:PTH1 family peptidyl-tRNA hydrolase
VHLVVGLGNPGSEFAGTRHNAGQEAVERLAARHGGVLSSERALKARVAEVAIPALRGQPAKALLAVPTTYMNDSGVAVRALVRRMGLSSPAELVVVHDELDLPPGRVKVKLGGGTAGHNGLESIRRHLHDDGFARVRIGIGKPPRPEAGADYVLRRPPRRERELLELGIELAADAVEELLAAGPAAAMTRFNRAPEETSSPPR